MNPSAENTPLSEGVARALEVSLRGVEELLPRDEWVKKLQRSEATGQPLRIKLGLDPTAPDIHIGHTVVLNKMRQLQDLGHQVIFLIGDFTTLIGDPSGRNSTRPPLTAEQIKVNAETYYTQAAKVLDPAKTEVRYNSEWCDQLGARGMIQLSAKYTVARMMERNDFHTRFTEGSSISLHEFLYPLLQGYDSVALKAEIAAGGNPKHAKVALAKEITTRFHSAAAADAAEQDFTNRSKGGIPDDIPEVALSGAPLGIGALLKQANLAPSTSEANRLIDGGGVRVDGGAVSDKGLKLEAGTDVEQVGKRTFARVALG